MTEKITESTVLKCNQGTENCELSVTSQGVSYIGEKRIATEEDKQPAVNIKSFGFCLLKPSPEGHLPCTPAPINWENTSAKEDINGHKVLLKTSVCSCSSGGIISILD